MRIHCLVAIIASFGCAAVARADIPPPPNPSPLPAPPIATPLEFRKQQPAGPGAEKAKPRLYIFRDAEAKHARIELPSDLRAALRQPVQTARLPVGLGFTGALIAAGLCFAHARMSRKQVVVSLLLAMLLGSLALAESASANTPPPADLFLRNIKEPPPPSYLKPSEPTQGAAATIETCKARIERQAQVNDVRIILPKK